MSNVAFDVETLRQRLVTKEQQNPSAARGSLSKSANRFREFVTISLATVQGSVPENDGISTIHSLKQDLCRELQLHDLDMKKLALQSQVAKSELIHYNSIAEETQSSILKCKDEIEDLKKILLHEKSIKMNKQQYNSLASSRERYCSRDTKRKLKETNIDIEMTRLKKAKIDRELKTRNKQFYLLTQSIHDLKANMSENFEAESTDEMV